MREKREIDEGKSEIKMEVRGRGEEQTKFRVRV